MAVAKFALDGVAAHVATPLPSPLTPVDIGSPVALVNVPLVGVPSIGVTIVKDVQVPVGVYDPPNSKNVSAASLTVLILLVEVRPVTVIKPVWPDIERLAALPPILNPEAVPVIFVPVNDEGVPPAPLNRTGAPADPVFTPNAVAIPVPKPLTPLLIGSPVVFVSVPLVGVPKIGVIKVGVSAKTEAPEPVSFVKAVFKESDVKEPNEAALPTLVTSPVKFALVVTFPAVSPEAVPVRFVATPEEGVPKAPPFTTNAPALPVFTPKAVLTPVPVVIVWLP